MVKGIAALFLGACLMGCLRPARRPPVAQKLSEKDRPSAPFHVPFADPISILSPFGERGRHFHTGIDIRTQRKAGEKVLAARAGKVRFASTMRGYGRMVVLRHSDGFESRYAHLGKIMVKLGQMTSEGQWIGTVGSSGRASTPHLHFEIRTADGRFVNPGYLIPQLKR